MSGRNFRIQKRYIREKTKSTFRATYKGHEIDISRERGARPWYIQVTSPNGCFAYDGWWGEEWNSMEEAITQALVGSCLVADPSPRRPLQHA